MPRTQLKQLSQPSYPGSKPIKHSDAFSPIIRTLSGKLILTSRGRVAFAKTHRGRLSHFQPTRGSTLATKWREFFPFLTISFLHWLEHLSEGVTWITVLIPRYKPEFRGGFFTNNFTSHKSGDWPSRRQNFASWY